MIPTPTTMGGLVTMPGLGFDFFPRLGKIFCWREQEQEQEQEQATPFFTFYVWDDLDNGLIPEGEAARARYVAIPPLY